MPRPRRRRMVRGGPKCHLFRPHGLRGPAGIILRVEELEAIRLKDLQGLNQKDSAEKMNVSQSTFHRILLEARKKLAKALDEGIHIRIHGGDYELVERE